MAGDIGTGSRPTADQSRCSRTRLGAALAGILIALTACSGAGQTGQDASAGGDGVVTATATATATPTPDAAPPTANREPTPRAAVPEVLGFEATTVTGAAFDGASLAGRPVVVWFWAPWCPVCRSQASAVRDLADEYGDRVAFVGVGSLDTDEAIASFAEDAPGPTHLNDPEGALYRRFRVTEQSSFVILDESGREVLRTGYDADEDVADTVARLAR